MYAISKAYAYNEDSNIQVHAVVLATVNIVFIHRDVKINIIFNDNNDCAPVIDNALTHIKYTCYNKDNEDITSKINRASIDSNDVSGPIITPIVLNSLSDLITLTKNIDTAIAFNLI